MFNVMGRKIILEKSQIIYDIPFSDKSLKSNWKISLGDWWIEKEWLTSKVRENGGGLIYSKNNFPGDIMLDLC